MFHRGRGAVELLRGRGRDAMQVADRRESLGIHLGERAFGARQHLARIRLHVGDATGDLVVGRPTVVRRAGRAVGNGIDGRYGWIHFPQPASRAGLAAASMICAASRVGTLAATEMIAICAATSGAAKLVPDHSAHPRNTSA